PVTKPCPAAAECTGGCDTHTVPLHDALPISCADSDGNVCTLAGCETSPTNPTPGVCVQTHTFATDSTPCPDSDSNACTTAGCNGAGESTRMNASNAQTADADCNGGRDTTSGQ